MSILAVLVSLTALEYMRRNFHTLASASRTLARTDRTLAEMAASRGRGEDAATRIASAEKWERTAARQARMAWPWPAPKEDA